MSTHDARLWILATVGLCACAWMPYVLDRFVRLGIRRTLANPEPGDAAASSPWAVRARAAHANAVENLAVFAPLALLSLRSERTALVSAACATYFAARLAHYLVYAAGLPGLRTLAFLTGFGAQVALLWVVAS